MKRLALIALVAGMAAPALAQEVDVQKAVSCQALVQQFGDSVKDAQAEDAAKQAATDEVKQGTQACTNKDYDAGMDQIRQAIQQIGLTPAR